MQWTAKPYALRPLRLPADALVIVTGAAWRLTSPDLMECLSACIGRQPPIRIAADPQARCADIVTRWAHFRHQNWIPAREATEFLQAKAFTHAIIVDDRTVGARQAAGRFHYAHCTSIPIKEKEPTIGSAAWLQREIRNGRLL